MRSVIPLLFALLLPAVGAADPFADSECQECHGVKGFSAPAGAAGMRPLHIDTAGFERSVHGELACSDCHSDIERLPHRKGSLARVDCIGCHLELPGRSWSPGSQAGWLQPPPAPAAAFSRDHLLSAHADSEVGGNAGCPTCHTAHYVYPSEDPAASTHRLNSPELCGACHAEALAEYRRSLHGAALKRPWQGEAATCSDCHSAHRVAGKGAVTAHRVVTEGCGNCHAAATDSYMTSTHGQLAWHGNGEAARCVDCHGSHAIRKVSDSGSPVNEANRIETCRQCHDGANANFVQYHPHGTTRDFDKYPLLWLLGKGMAVLILSVLLFFYGHSLLWFYREKRERPVRWHTVASRSYPVRVKRKKPDSGMHFRRFAWGWRINHWLLALSLMTLVFTGMAVMYPDTGWATTVVAAAGGVERFGVIHRVAGVIFLLTVFGHAAVVLVRLLRDPGFRWFGPDSLLPRRQDWHDMKAQFRWFFGRGAAPRLGRWTYWEKFDYWAVYWGALVVGLSGLLLWFSDSIGRVVPGWIFNLASIAHGLEAFLAVMTLFVVHFFNNHFRPAKFPLDTVMFTGSWDLEELKEERPAEYDRLVAAGALDRHLVAPPSRRALLLWHAIGFALLGTGLLLLLLVVDGFLQRGLF